MFWFCLNFPGVPHFYASTEPCSWTSELTRSPCSAHVSSSHLPSIQRWLLSLAATSFVNFATFWKGHPVLKPDLIIFSISGWENSAFFFLPLFVSGWMYNDFIFLLCSLIWQAKKKSPTENALGGVFPCIMFSMRLPTTFHLLIYDYATHKGQRDICIIPRLLKQLTNLAFYKQQWS